MYEPVLAIHGPRAKERHSDWQMGSLGSDRFYEVRFQVESMSN